MVPWICRMEFSLGKLCHSFGTVNQQEPKFVHQMCSCTLVSNSAVITARRCLRYKDPCLGNITQFPAETSANYVPQIVITFPSDYTRGILYRTVKGLVYFDAPNGTRTGTKIEDDSVDDLALIFVRTLNLNNLIFP